MIRIGSIVRPKAGGSVMILASTQLLDRTCSCYCTDIGYSYDYSYDSNYDYGYNTDDTNIECNSSGSGGIYNLEDLELVANSYEEFLITNPQFAIL